MLFIGYFEGIDSQRGIAWRCADSLGLRAFLDVPLTENTPVHASMTIIRKRLSEAVFAKVFLFVLGLLDQKGLLRGKTLGIDATTLEANAAMKSIVRKDTGADWQEYLRQLAKAEGLENPTDEDLRRLDRKRTDKKVSNQEWESRTDGDSRITKMRAVCAWCESEGRPSDLGEREPLYKPATTHCICAYHQRRLLELLPSK